jgi:cell division protein FtsL
MTDEKKEKVVIPMLDLEGEIRSMNRRIVQLENENEKLKHQIKCLQYEVELLEVASYD